MRRLFASIAIAFFVSAIALVITANRAWAASPPTIDRHAAEADRLLEKSEAYAAELKELQAGARIEGMSLAEVLKHKGLEADIASFVQLHRIELSLAEAPASAKRWMEVSQELAKTSRTTEARAAAWKAYDLATENVLKADAVEELAKYFRTEQNLQRAIEYLEYAVSLDDTKPRRAHLDAVRSQATLRINDVAVDVESFTPSACLVMSSELSRGRTAEIEDYVRLEGAADVSVRANGKRICLSGLTYGASLKVTLLAGLTGSDGSRLYRDVSRTVTVPDRKARINFGNGTYILPKVGDETVPLKTVNMTSVELKLYRVSDRGLVPLLNSGVKSDAFYQWEEERLGNEYGTLIWEGAMDVEGTPNKDVTTLVPIRDLIDGKGPGVYALVASDPAEDKKQRYRYEHQAQWLLVSDLGLMTLSGDDGLHVFVHSLETTKPVRSVTLKLVARDNAILSETKTDRSGHGQFAAALLRGKGGAMPAAVVAETDKGDYAFLSLDGTALDLSDRGTSGRHADGPLDAYVFTERGIYRPGETVHLSAVLRDMRAVAVPNLPLTFKVFRPDGMEALKTKLTGDQFGGYAYEQKLSLGARTGQWRAAFYADDEDKPVGDARFMVEDFVPERLSATLEAGVDAVTSSNPVDVTVQADFLYGAPGADLKGQLSVSLEKDPQPFPNFKAYSFGLVQDEFQPQPPKRQDFVTDANGTARVSVAFAPLPDTSHVLRARVAAEVTDVGGRPVADLIAMPVRQSTVFLGVKTEGRGGFDESDAAKLSVVALSNEGEPIAEHGVNAVWVREHYQYSWYRLDGSWRFRSSVVDEVIAEETLETGQDGTIELERMLAGGRYRLDVFDAEGKAASSRRFHVGWWAAATSPDVPDALELTVDETALNAGDRLRGFVKAPFEGRALITVVNERLVDYKLITLEKDGSTFDFKVGADWGPGAYVLATALRPDAGEISRLPVRATGLKWFSVGRAAKVQKLKIDAPEVTLPGRAVDIPVTVEGGKPGEAMKVIVAAVDEGILNITRFKSPNPDTFFYGQRAFAMDLRDVYGRLIRTEEGTRGTLRTGGDNLEEVMVTGMRRAADGEDEANNMFAALSRTSRTVALIRRDIVLDETGSATVSFDLPDFAGKLRLMAVAYGTTMLGVGEANMTVRTPVVAELILPRFLAPGDNAVAMLSVQNLSGSEKALRIALDAKGSAVKLADPDMSAITLAQKERRDIPVVINGMEPGDAALHLALSADGIEEIRREWGITVRAAWPYATKRTQAGIVPGASHTFAATDTSDFYRVTTSGSLTLSTRPNLEANRMMRELNAYAYRCTEQTVSRAFPSLYHDQLSALYGDMPVSKTDAANLIDRAIVTIMDRQKSDGGFGIWSLLGGNSPWLDAYTTDFLLRAAEAGYEVPDAVTSLALNRLRSIVNIRNYQYPHAQAYAFYVLARVGDVSASEVRYFADHALSKVNTPLALAQMAAALHHVGERDAAEKMFIKAYKFSRPKAYYSDYGSSIRDNAAFVSLVAEVMPNSALVADLSDVLERFVSEKSWLSTQEMAWISRAAASFADDSGTNLSASINGDKVSSAKGIWAGTIGKTVPEGELTIANEGAVTLRAVKLLRGVPKAAPEASDNGLKITRHYFDMDGKPVNIAEVKQNDRIVVLLDGKATIPAIRDTLVVDLLPAGLEIETTDVSSLKFLPDLSGTEFEDARDDRYVAALKLGEYRGWRNNQIRLAYIVRAVTVGDYVQPGTFAEDMYQPEYHTQGAVSRVRVVK
ncbi:alpha-2-macroglobulin [Kordiimonas gwangyangensis]|uniref:alpha-2-macroglobulin n=1 Tax=Kordiimonas gwangyangensis TaxID=288022 RepID=UPI00036E7C13|nr:alpha-2-macroglobulin [Kordiimonas gwangyangensis]